MTAARVSALVLAAFAAGAASTVAGVYLLVDRGLRRAKW